MTENDFAAKSYTFGWGNHDFLCDFFILSTSFPELPLAVPGFLSGKVKLLTVYRIVQDVLVFFRDNSDIFYFCFLIWGFTEKNHRV